MVPRLDPTAEGEFDVFNSNLTGSRMFNNQEFVDIRKAKNTFLRLV